MLERLARPLLALPRPFKRLLALSFDALLCVLTLWLAMSLRLEQMVGLSGPFLLALGVSWLLALPLFAVRGFYRAIFRYAGWHAMVAMLTTLGIYAVLFAGLFTVVGVEGVPRSVGVTQPLLLMLLVGGSRAWVHRWLGGGYRRALQQGDAPGVLIYGAGWAGRQLAAALRNAPEPQRLLGFLDDDPQLQGHSVNGWKVHAPTDLPALIDRLDATDVLLALPSVARARRLEIVETLRPYPVHVRTLPGVSDLAAGRVQLSDLQELDIDDLLGRAPVDPTPELLNRDTQGQVVLVTGAGGSIGSELCRQILRCRPSRLLLVERTEFALYQVHQDLLALRAEHAPEVEIVPLLASVGTRYRMQEIMQTWRPHTVYHAAAYKHVPLVEHNAAEGIYNNVWGTWICAETAAQAGVRNFVLVSTDKAVRPTNIMGASKRLSELVLQALADRVPAVHGSQGTCFSMVRFGNVLGSSGSVVPLFREQIRKGGPITLTHQDINRFFMTIPEAAQLVIQAGAMAGGGDVFVLDMGQPVRIYDLARRMVELSGLSLRDEANPNGDIAIEITGLRPGEKLYEELLIGDNPKPTQHQRIMKAHEDFLPWPDLEPRLAELREAINRNDVPVIKAMLLELVHGYQPADGVVDWVHQENERQANELQVAVEPA